MNERDSVAIAVRGVRDVDFRLVDDGLELGLKAYRGFAPGAFHGVNAILDIMTDRGRRLIPGSLETVRTAIPSGVWYKYRFVPDRSHEIFFILDWDCLWSNVLKIQLVTLHGLHDMYNPFFRQPFAAPV